MRKLLPLAVFVLLAHPVSAQTADEVVARYIAARGGMARIKALKSERVSGTISFGPNAEGPLVVERERPLKMHMELTVAGRTMVRVYDGKNSGWVYNPFLPSPAVQPMTDADVHGMVDEADFEGPFVDSKAKGNQIEFAGKDLVDGQPAWKLKLTSKSGDSSFFLFDAATGLIQKWQGTRKIDGKDVPWESRFTDYREVDGLKYPFLIEFYAPGTDQKQTITAEKIEVNIPIDPSHFAKPTPPPEPAAPAPAIDPAKPN